MKIRVPTLGAYIFQKGLIFTRRYREVKKAKDLYYIFDILSNCEALHSEIVREIWSFKTAYTANWSKKFIRNLKRCFSNVNADGIRLVKSQRPGNALPNMNDDQFKQYVLGTFQDFIIKIENNLNIKRD